VDDLTVFLDALFVIVAALTILFARLPGPRSPRPGSRPSCSSHCRGDAVASADLLLSSAWS
jgi:hypothetical protein